MIHTWLMSEGFSPLQRLPSYILDQMLGKVKIVVQDICIDGLIIETGDKRLDNN